MTHQKVINRLIHARNDLLTSFDLRAQIFRVNVEFSTCYHGQKKFFEKMTESDLSARKKFMTHNQGQPDAVVDFVVGITE